jgi:hypothetical protein
MKFWLHVRSATAEANISHHAFLEDVSICASLNDYDAFYCQYDARFVDSAVVKSARLVVLGVLLMVHF